MTTRYEILSVAGQSATNPNPKKENTMNTDNTPTTGHYLVRDTDGNTLGIFDNLDAATKYLNEFYGKINGTTVERWDGSDHTGMWDTRITVVLDNVMVPF